MKISFKTKKARDIHGASVFLPYTECMIFEDALRQYKKNKKNHPVDRKLVEAMLETFEETLNMDNKKG